MKLQSGVSAAEPSARRLAVHSGESSGTCAGTTQTERGRQTGELQDVKLNPQSVLLHRFSYAELNSPSEIMPKGLCGDTVYKTYLT